MSATSSNVLTAYPARYCDAWSQPDLDGRATSVHAHYDTLTLLKAIGLA